MIKFDLNGICRMKSITNLSAYLRANGFNKAAIARYTRLGITMMTFKELEKLCVLFRCTPNDLMVWIPETNSSLEKDHPLEKLRTQQRPDLLSTIKSIPTEKIAEADARLKELIGG